MQQLTSSSGPGSVLRRSREQHGLSLADVETSTKIGRGYLAALEEDAPLEDFPAPIFARLFLREYAGHLGLDDGELLRAFDRQHGPIPALEIAAPPEIHIRRPWRRRLGLGRWQRRLLATVVLVSVLAAAAIAGWVAWERFRADASAVVHRDPVVVAPPQDPPAGRRVLPFTPAGPIEVEVSIRAKEACWIRIEADGELLAERILDPGDEVAFSANRKMVLRFGNAAGVRLVVNGDTIPTSAAGVLQLTFVERDGRIVAR